MRKLLAIVSLFGLLFMANSASAACVNINKASAADLQTVKGIGPVKARAIVAHRKKHGGFGNLGDLSGVKGFGAQSASRFKGKLCARGGTSRVAKKASSDKKSSGKSVSVAEGGSTSGNVLDKKPSAKSKKQKSRDKAKAKKQKAKSKAKAKKQKAKNKAKKAKARKKQQK